jgi:hypothetical protein
MLGFLRACSIPTWCPPPSAGDSSYSATKFGKISAAGQYARSHVKSRCCWLQWDTQSPDWPVVPLSSISARGVALAPIPVRLRLQLVAAPVGFRVPVQPGWLK